MGNNNAKLEENIFTTFVNFSISPVKENFSLYSRQPIY